MVLHGRRVRPCGTVRQRLGPGPPGQRDDHRGIRAVPVFFPERAGFVYRAEISQFRTMGTGLVAAGRRPAGLVLRHTGRTGHRRPPGMDRNAGDGGSVAGSDDCLSDQQD